MIRFACPHCRKRLKSPDHGAGRKIACPRCRQRLIIPSPMRDQDEAVLVEAVPESANSATISPSSVEPAAAVLPVARVEGNCSRCGARLEVADVLAGCKIMCRECSTRQIVPRPRSDRSKTVIRISLAALFGLIGFILVLELLAIMTGMIIRSGQPTIYEGLNAEQWAERFRTAVAHKNELTDPAYDAIFLHLPARETVPVFLKMLQEDNPSTQVASALRNFEGYSTEEKQRLAVLRATGHNSRHVSQKQHKRPMLRGRPSCLGGERDNSR